MLTARRARETTAKSLARAAQEAKSWMERRIRYDYYALSNLKRRTFETIRGACANHMSDTKVHLFVKTEQDRLDLVTPHDREAILSEITDGVQSVARDLREAGYEAVVLHDEGMQLPDHMYVSWARATRDALPADDVDEPTAGEARALYDAALVEHAATMKRYLEALARDVIELPELETKVQDTVREAAEHGKSEAEHGLFWTPWLETSVQYLTPEDYDALVRDVDDKVRGVMDALRAAGFDAELTYAKFQRLPRSIKISWPAISDSFSL